MTLENKQKVIAQMDAALVSGSPENKQKFLAYLEEAILVEDTPNENA
jgi:hypothetical protein